MRMPSNRLHVVYSMANCNLDKDQLADQSCRYSDHIKSVLRKCNIPESQLEALAEDRVLWSLMSTDYITAPRVCWPLKFLQTLDTGQGLLAHTANLVRGLPKKFKVEQLKLSLKFHT